MLEQKIAEIFGDKESAGFGTGWWSGILGAFFGVLSLGGVLCLHFPQLLSSPEIRPHYSMPAIRLLMQGVILAAILFGVANSILRKKKILGLTGILLALLATAWGGASVQINETLHDGPALGLDWFLLDMFLMGLIFTPLEIIWPQYPKQGPFRNEWTLDVVYFMSTHLPIQVLSFFVLLPATEATKYLGVPGLQEFIARMPWLLQFFLAVVVADFAEYFIHFVWLNGKGKRSDRLFDEYSAGERGAADRSGGDPAADPPDRTVVRGGD